MTNPNEIPMMQIQGAQAGGGLTLRSLGVGRLVMVMPKREQMGKPFKGDEAKGPKRELVCDVVVLDGGPVVFGGEANSDGTMKSPDTMVVDQPAGLLIPAMIIRAPGMFFSLDAALPSQHNPHGSAVVGRLWKDAAYGNTWKLQEDPPAHEVQLAHDWYARYASGQHVNPVPRPIAQRQTQQVSYGQVPQQGYGQVPQQGYGQVQPGAIPQQYAPPTQGQPQNLGGQMAPVQQGAQPGWTPQQAAPAPAAVQPAPAGWDPAIWAGLTDVQRAQIMPPAQANASAYAY